jgi:hypothetical protein
MAAGMLTNWYVSKLKKSKSVVEYIRTMREFTLYNINVFNFNIRNYFK